MANERCIGKEAARAAGYQVVPQESSEEEMREPCKVCGGVGWIPQPAAPGTVMCYYNPTTGSSWPEMTCPNCGGAKFVGMSDVQSWPDEQVSD
jgi:hypothetical protein